MFIVYRYRREQVPEEIFDILISFTDFLVFKQMFLEFKTVSKNSDTRLFLELL